MPVSEVVVSRDELQILLNMENEISIMYPFYKHFQLLTAKPEEDGYRLKVFVGEYDFDREVERFDHFALEMPGYADFLECLVAGILKYKNEKDFIEKLKHYRSMTKRVYFCPDTNVIYHRFISNSSLFKQNEVLLVDTVKKEIEAALNYKYNPHQISELKNLVKYQKFLLDEWVNKRMKKSRKAAYIALREYRKVRDLAVEIESIEKSTRDSEYNDRIIIKSVRRFEKERNALPVLLTADVSMVDICELEGVEYFLFEYPHVISADYCNAEQMLELVYCLAVVFGVIRLNSTVVFGEFRGKSRHEELKLRFLDENMVEEFERDLRTCRKLMALGIEK
ncbi:MAG: hypothetical protein DSY33_05370 [Archaeoglobus sp.]|nr:MAG: hypothetical protein DSY33_05370 [Archaeoglobus sp.]